MSEQDIKQHLMPNKKAVDYSELTVALPHLVRSLQDALSEYRSSDAIEIIEAMVFTLRNLECYLGSNSAMIALHPVNYVRRFHEVYGHPIEEVPTIPDAKRRLLRVRLLCEELAEFCKASGFPIAVVHEDSMLTETIPLSSVTPEMSQDNLVDIVEAADGLGDLNVVVNGAALEWGIPIAQVDTEIHRSNMSKLGEDGKPITDAHGKTQKGPEYVPPNISLILKRAGWV